MCMNVSCGVKWGPSCGPNGEKAEWYICIGGASDSSRVRDFGCLVFEVLGLMFSSGSLVVIDADT